jgi:hypothetical protein
VIPENGNAPNLKIELETIGPVIRETRKQIERSFAKASEVMAGNLSRQKSRDTDLPIGCSESESKSGLSSRYPMRKGRPEASLRVVDEQRGGIHIPGPVGRLISRQGLTLLIRGATVHTTCH